MNTTLPYRISAFPRAAARAEKPLRRLVVVADLFAAGCSSLSRVARRTEELPDGFGLSTIRALPDDPALVALLTKCFGRPVEVYKQPAHEGGPVTGLSSDGLRVVEMAREYLAAIDEPVR